MKHSYLILTDSGGLQEEAPSLGKPVLVLRQVTERPEAVETGTAEVVGTQSRAIVEATVKLLLEQSAWADYTRVDRVSRDELGMKPPLAKNMVIVKR